MTSLHSQVAYGLCATAETLFTASGGFAMKASDLQIAILRMADGRPLKALADHPAVKRGVGDVSKLPGTRCHELAILSGIRSGKSLIAACLAIHWAVTCDVSRLGPGEVARVSIVSTAKDNAQVIFDHIVGQLEASEYLSSLIVNRASMRKGHEDAKQGRSVGGTVLLRHQALNRRGRNHVVEIVVTAGSRAGSGLTSRWSAGCIFDEFPRMVGDDDAVVNWDDQRAAVLLRLLPGAQLVHVGSPWAPYGPAYLMVEEHFGKPTENLVVVWAPGYDMNPSIWTPEACEKAKAKDPDVYMTDVEAKFASQEEGLFGSTELGLAKREGPYEVPPKPANHYVAAIDPAHRANAWTLVVGTREGRKKIIVLARQWIGTKSDPLTGGQVLAEIGEVCHSYGIEYVETDQYHVDSLVELARSTTYTTRDGETRTKRPVRLVQVPITQAEVAASWLAIRTKVNEGEVEFPADPAYVADLQRLKKRTTQGGVSIHLPKTSDGRHCDYAPPTLMVGRTWLRDAEPPPPEDPEKERLRREELRMLAEAKKTWGRTNSQRR